MEVRIVCIPVILALSGLHLQGWKVVLDESISFKCDVTSKCNGSTYLTKDWGPMVQACVNNCRETSPGRGSAGWQA